MSILDRWEADLARTREAYGDEFRDPLRPPLRERKGDRFTPAQAAALEAAGPAGYVLPPAANSALVQREWRRRCEARGWPAVFVTRQHSVRTFTLTCDLRTLPGSPSAEAVEQVLAMLRRASEGRNCVTASAVMLIGSRLPGESVEALAAAAFGRLVRPAFPAPHHPETLPESQP